MCTGCGNLVKNQFFLQLLAKQYNGKTNLITPRTQRIICSVEVYYLAGLEKATLCYFQFSRSVYIFS